MMCNISKKFGLQLSPVQEFGFFFFCKIYLKPNLTKCYIVEYN